MGLKNKLKLLTEISIPKFIYYNFMCKSVVRNGRGYLIPYRHSVINIDKGAKIVIHDGHFAVNYVLPKGAGDAAYVLMRKNSTLEIFGAFQIYYKSTVELHENAIVSLGSGYINTGSVILAAEKISIGNEAAIGREVFIYDSDHHHIVDECGNQVNHAKPVIIEDHVWIGLKSTILKGSKIGTGAVIGANSLVTGNIEPNKLAVGSPARVQSEIRWGN